MSNDWKSTSFTRESVAESWHLRKAGPVSWSDLQKCSSPGEESKSRLKFGIWRLSDLLRGDRFLSKMIGLQNLNAIPGECKEKNQACEMEGGWQNDRNRSRVLVVREVYPHPFFGTYHTRTFMYGDRQGGTHDTIDTCTGCSNTLDLIVSYKEVKIQDWRRRFKKQQQSG